MFSRASLGRRQTAAKGASGGTNVLYRLIFDTLPDGVVIIDLDGRITAANRAQAEMYLYRRAPRLDRD